MAEYFFELLTEEIPAWMFQSSWTTPVDTALEKLCGELGGGKWKTDATSRRLIIFLRDLPLREEDREIEVKGPPKKSPDAALQGFLKKQNATTGDIIESADEYIRIRKKIAGRDISALVQERIPQLIESLRWPKMMRWGAGGHSYIRPVHSIVSIFEGEHLPVTIFGVASDVKTVGHRTLAPQPFKVDSYHDYLKKLELASVDVEAAHRKNVMVQRALVLAKQAGGVPSEDVSIWAQWQYLTEYPGVVRAEFRPEYLALPEEVLVTVMRVHQKQLPIRDRDGKLTSSFLAVLDNEGDPEGNAAYGNSFVTNARFADAQFFYDTDRRKKLEERIEQLAHLQFQEKLGNYAEKTERVKRIAIAIASHIDADLGHVETAAKLCKADLVTEMVKEFTDLQGKVGGIYAREEGLPEPVWQAIYDHYQPANVDDALPRNLVGVIVSLADRLDTLTGFFRIGLKPTGSKDPFALRRAAQGAVQILLNRDQREVRLSIGELLDLVPESAAARTDLVAFFAERIATILEASAWQFAYDEIRAVMESGWLNIPLTDLVDRISALKAIRDEADFLSLLDSVKRITNITQDHDSTRVDASLFDSDIERRLNELADLVSSQIADFASERRYREALQSFAALAPELEKFFDDVMVMVDDERVRANRKSLLMKTAHALKPIADVRQIVVDRRDYRT
ncbi:MAG: glycine--tRNA ligase subunit beta [Acidobacteria bacterium]|nr:MAG: glycine--tRNA ligase subunit beta [Acidobacteriota bacterium]